MGIRQPLTACVLACALAACPTVDLGDTPSDIGQCNPAGGIDYFQNVIWPNYITAGAMACTSSGGCHNEAGGNALNLRTQPVDFALNFRQAQVYLNCGTPEMSDLLTKPLSTSNPHGGGDLISPGDPRIQLFLDWF
jgi:hypothetical protein